MTRAVWILLTGLSLVVALGVVWFGSWVTRDVVSIRLVWWGGAFVFTQGVLLVLSFGALIACGVQVVEFEEKAK